jgi:hypothetical protein
VSKTDSAFKELKARLDDGNNYPGFFVERNGDSFTVYEEGYGSE